MSKSKPINWRQQKQREAIFLRTGKFPNRTQPKSKPTIFYGFNTVSR